MGNLLNRYDQQQHIQQSPQFNKKQLSLYSPQQGSVSTTLFNINKSFNPDNETLIQLITSNQTQIQNIKKNIKIYQQLQKEFNNNKILSPISMLKQSYFVSKSTYCSKYSTFYLIFEGSSNNFKNTLKDQFNIRVIKDKYFKNEQILTILKVYLTSLKIYFKKFNRIIQKIDLDDICFDNNTINSKNNSQNNKIIIKNENNRKNMINQKNKTQQSRMYFIDPYVKQKKQQQKVSVNELNILLQNPSPERLQQYKSQLLSSTQITQPSSLYLNHLHKNNDKFKYRNHKQQQKLNSTLFSIGVIGLKLLQMTLVDDIYIKSPNKCVNFQKIQQYVNKHKKYSQLNNEKDRYSFSFNNFNTNNNINQLKQLKSREQILSQKLIKGIEILLSINSQQRANIYHIWKDILENNNEICIQRQNFQIQNHIKKQIKQQTYKNIKQNQNILQTNNKYKQQYISISKIQYLNQNNKLSCHEVKTPYQNVRFN